MLSRMLLPFSPSTLQAWVPLPVGVQFRVMRLVPPASKSQSTGPMLVACRQPMCQRARPPAHIRDMLGLHEADVGDEHPCVCEVVMATVHHLGMHTTGVLEVLSQQWEC